MYIKPLLLILIALQVLDTISTVKAIKNGKGHEANPFMAWLHSVFGLVIGTAAPKIIALSILAYTLPAANAHPQMATIGLAALSIFYTVIVYKNFKLLKE